LSVETSNIMLDGIDLQASLNSSFMDPKFYSSREIFKLDVERIFPSSWVLVGDTDQLKDCGDVLVGQIGVEPIIVVKGDDNRMRGFINICSHRGSTLIENSGNCGLRITCPYHAWVFDLNGDLRGVPNRLGFKDPIELKKLGLTEISVEAWEKLVFVNPSRTAKPLLEYLGDIPRLLRNHGVSDEYRGVSFVHTAKANWKLLVDNGFCDYHVPVVHPRLMPLIERLETWEEKVGQYVNVLKAPLTDLGLSEQADRISLSGDVELINEISGLTMAFGVYPNLLLLAFRNGSVHTITWWPIDIDQTEVRVQTYTHDNPTADDLRYGASSVERLQLEDIEVCERVQKGLQSNLFRVGPRHYLESRVRGFQQTYQEDIAKHFSMLL